MTEQNGSCAICGKASNALCVDHNHTTNEVRGLLCQKDNKLLGFARESIINLARSIKYLAENGSYTKRVDEGDPDQAAQIVQAVLKILK